MKSRWDDNEFNTPEEMMARATFLACVAGFTAGILMMLGGAAVGDLRFVTFGGGLLGIAAVAKAWLCRRGKFEPAEATWREDARDETSANSARVEKLVQMLQKWDRLESQRGTPAFDPWALQALRHDIHVLIDNDPALEGLFQHFSHAA